MRSRGGVRTITLLTATTLLLSVCAGCSTSAASTGPTHTISTAAATGAPVPSSGCATTGTATTPATTDLRQTIEVDGTPRWYLLDLPASTVPSPTTTTGSSPGTGTAVPRPLVLDFHGLGEGATLHSITSRFGQLGRQDGFDVAFPNGTGTPVQWATASQTSNPDLAFVTALLDHLESTLCIDTSRVYASGFSDGAFMVSLLACTMSDRFAAIAAVSGLQLPKPCRTTHRMPILTFHGTADPILFFNGGIGYATLGKLLGKGAPVGAPGTTAPPRPKVELNGPGYPATVQAWAVKDGCNPRSVDTRQSSQIIIRRYACPSGTGVEFVIVLGGGHAWPGSAFSRSISSLTGFTTFQIAATPTIWSFFRRFQL